MTILSILLASLASMILGSIWYSPKVFLHPWLKGIQKPIEMINKKASFKAMIGSFFLVLLTAYVLNFFLDILQVTSILNAIMVAVIISVGFVTTTRAMDVLYQQRPKNLILIDGAYNLISFAIMSIVLVLFK